MPHRVAGEPRVVKKENESLCSSIACLRVMVKIAASDQGNALPVIS